MGRKKNSVKTSSLTITLTPQLREYLEWLVTLGAYGSNPAQAAVEVLNDSLKAEFGEHRKEKFREFEYANQEKLKA